jgi:hypothetical protein
VLRASLCSGSAPYSAFDLAPGRYCYAFDTCFQYDPRLKKQHFLGESVNRYSKISCLAISIRRHGIRLTSVVPVAEVQYHLYACVGDRSGCGDLHPLLSTTWLRTRS